MSEQETTRPLSSHRNRWSPDACDMLESVMRSGQLYSVPSSEIETAVCAMTPALTAMDALRSRMT